MKTYVHLWQYFAEFFLEWEPFQTKVAEKIKTHILCSILFFENRAVCEVILQYMAERDGPQMTI